MTRHPEDSTGRGRGYREGTSESRERYDRGRPNSDRRSYFGEDQGGWNPEGDERWAAEPGMRGKHEESSFGREPGGYTDQDPGGAALPQSRDRALGNRGADESGARRGRGSYDPDYYYPDDRRERRVRDRDYYAAGNNDDRNMTFDRANGEVSAWLDGRDAVVRRQTDANHRGRGPRNYVRSDDRIRDDINDRLSEDPDIDASDMEVSVAEGEVTLTGTVTERFAKRHAEDIAESITGVRHVQNNLRVKGAGSNA